MDKSYMNKAIADVIREFPEAGILLDRYGVSCVTCSVGICLFKDVLNIHNFKRDDEKLIMGQITEIVEKGTRADDYALVLEPEGETPAEGRKFEYSPDLEILVDEHDNIKRVLAKIPDVIASMRKYDESRKEGDPSSMVKEKNTLNSIIYFIRKYADGYHHAKEEDILFKTADGNSEIIKAMYDDHAAGRSYVRSAVDAIEAGDPGKLEESLMAYRELLFGHIQREDEVLYPWFDRNLTPAQLEGLSPEFAAADARAGAGFVEGILIFIKGLESRF